MRSRQQHGTVLSMRNPVKASEQAGPAQVGWQGSGRVYHKALKAARCHGLLCTKVVGAGVFPSFLHGVRAPAALIVT